MPPKIFLTGSTGYIGGSVLHTITTSHPSYFITVLLRRTPEKFSTYYPGVKVIAGDYNSTSLLTQHAAQADIVIHCGDSDHVSSLTALLAGLSQRDTPGYLLHLSGSGIVSDWRTPSSLGHPNPKIWSDTTDVSEIASLPKEELHRATEEILHAHIANPESKVNIAIMCPPDIYGRGKGPGKTSSALIPMYVNEILKSKAKRAFYVKEGTNTRSWVHVDDLMRLYLRVVEAAAEPDKYPAAEYFNGNGYYFASTQEHSQRDVAVAVGAVLYKHGVIEDAEPLEVDLEQVDQMANIWPAFPKLGRYLFASNSRTRAERAKALWGYKGVAAGLMECLEQDVLDAMGGKIA
jgi:nucleoside-diphosphate-sugar epimerase